MSYYVRAFGTSSEVPALREIFEWAASRGQDLRIDRSFTDVDLDSPEWKGAIIVDDDGKVPFQQADAEGFYQGDDLLVELP